MKFDCYKWFLGNIFISAGVKGGDIMPILSRGRSRKRVTKAETGKWGVSGRFGRGKSRWQGLAWFSACGGREGQKTGRGELTRLLWRGRSEHYPTRSVASTWFCYKCTECYSYTNCTKGACGKEEEVFFLFFLLDEGLLQGGGVGYSCTRCYSCTICTKCVIKSLFL